MGHRLNRRQRALFPVFLLSFFCGLEAFVADCPAFLLVAGASEPAVLYREIFPNPGGVNADLAESGWKAFGGRNATAIPFGGNMALSGVAGYPQDVAPVNAHPANAERRRGFLYNRSTAVVPHLLFTDEIDIDLEATPVAEIGWYQSSVAGDSVRLAVLVDGAWHVSGATYATAGGCWGRQALRFPGSDWLSLDFAENTLLSLGPETALTGTRLQGVGFFVQELTDKLRLDTVEIRTAGGGPDPQDVPVQSESLLQGFTHPPVVFNPGDEYGSDARNYQGIPGIERAPGGRLWATWYAGPVWEDHYNYILVATSGDDAKTWTDTSFVIDPDGDGPKRVADPCLWLDPGGKLWMFYWLNGDGLSVTMAMTTENPDDGNPVWSEPRPLFPGVMMNKPIITSKGEWLMPSAMWHRAGSSRVIVSKDHGQTWALRGTANVPPERRNCDEEMIVEREDGSLWMLVRTADYGIGESVSTDNGMTWIEVSDYQKHATTRFTLLKLKSGNLLLIRNGPLDVRGARDRMTAYLSTDDGASWMGGLLLDERDSSYPDATQAPDGTIYAIYDHSRGVDKNILMAVFTEEDMLAREYVSPVARQKVLVNRATGINPKIGFMGDGPPLASDAAAAELIADGQRAGLECADGQSLQALRHSIHLFSDSDYIAHNFNRDATSGFFYGKRFVLSLMGHTEAVCVSPGMVYVFTPAPTRNPESVEAELLAQGFEKTSVKEFHLIFKLDEKARLENACSVYQKHVETGERIVFGQWGLLVF